jgi:hypothetical protein
MFSFETDLSEIVGKHPFVQKSPLALYNHYDRCFKVHEVSLAEFLETHRRLLWKSRGKYTVASKKHQNFVRKYIRAWKEFAFSTHVMDHQDWCAIIQFLVFNFNQVFSEEIYVKAEIRSA